MPSGEPCKQQPGVMEPVVDLARCEGKAACAKVCPKDVFEIAPITVRDRAGLTGLQRFKIWVHGGRVAYAVRAHACQACGDCVSACPEDAITLQRRAAM